MLTFKANEELIKKASNEDLFHEYEYTMSELQKVKPFTVSHRECLKQIDMIKEEMLKRMNRQ